MPVVNPPLREVRPPMAAEASSGINQQLTLDHSSFEKLLAAAWVIQCLQDHLHGHRVERDETIVEPVATQKQIEPASSGLQVAMKPVLQASPTVIEADGKHDALNAWPADHEALAELIETPQPVQTATLNFDAAVKTAPETAEFKPETAEFKKSLPVEDMAPAHPIKPPAPVLATSAKHRDKQPTRRRAAFNLQTAFNRTVNAFNGLLPPFPTFRVNLSPPALRAVAIATPVWLLSLVAALLFLEVWRYEPLHSAQAISKPTPPATAEIAVDNKSRSLTTTTRAIPEEVKSTDNEPRRSRTVPPLEVSHKHITDPATLSAVEQLSRYEINGLRRQARYGEESAAFTLGMAYEVGRFVPQNCVEAAHWVTTAADEGDAAAQYNLGLRYRDGDGIPANRAESEKWLRKAAVRRNRQAKRALKMLASR